MNSQNNDIPQGFKMTELGLLPEEWEAMSLKQVGSLKDGDWILRHDYSEEGVRLLQIADIGQGIFLDKSKRYISLERARELGCTFLEAGDILISRMAEPIGRACKLPILPYPTITAVDVTIFRAKSDIVDSNYALFSLNSRIALAQVAQLTYGVTRNRVTRRNLERILLPLPPLPEQKAIAWVLSTIQKAIETQDKIITAAKELKKSLMRHLFTYGPVSVAEAEKVSLKETEIGPVPEHWEVIPFTESLTKRKGNIPDSIQQHDYKTVGKYPIIDQSENYIAGYTDDSKHIYSPELPVVIFGDHTRILKFVDFPFAIGADGTKILHPNPHLFDPKFYYYCLTTLDIPSRGYNRHFKILKEKAVIKPPIIEQQEIARILSGVDQKIEAEERKKTSLQALFKTMLHHLMTGKVRVKELEARV